MRKTTIENLVTRLDEVKGVLIASSNENAMLEECREKHVNPARINSIVRMLNALYDDEVFRDHQNLDDILLSGVERLYCTVFDCDGRTTEVCKYMPKDVNTMWDAIFDNPTIINLTPREVKVIRSYFFEEKTLEEIGNECGVGRERIRQVIAKGIRKLRHPVRRKKLVLGLDYEDEFEKQYSEVRQRVIDDLIAKKLSSDTEVHELTRENDIMETPLEELNLSVRSYNALRYKGITTLRDIIALTYRDLYRSRNLGKKSLEEIIEKVRVYCPDYLKETSI